MAVPMLAILAGCASAPTDDGPTVEVSVDAMTQRTAVASAPARAQPFATPEPVLPSPTAPVKPASKQGVTTPRHAPRRTYSSAVRTTYRSPYRPEIRTYAKKHKGKGKAKGRGKKR